MNPATNIHDRQAPPPGPGGRRAPEVERDTRKSPGIVFYMRRHEDSRRRCVIATSRAPYTILGFASGGQRGWTCTRECFAILRKEAARCEATVEEESHAGH